MYKKKGDKVFATGRREKLKSLGVDFWDNISAQILFKNGATFTVDAGWTLPEGFEAIVNQGIDLSLVGLACYSAGFFETKG